MTRRFVIRPTPRHFALAACSLLGLTLAAACSEPPPAPPAATTPAVKSPEDKLARYQECWSLYNAKDWDKFGECYTENAVSEQIDSTPPTITGRAAIIDHDKQYVTAFPDRHGDLKLILGNGTRALSIALFTGTNDGPMPPGPDGKSAPATHKKIGLYMAHTIDWDGTGAAAAQDAGYFEEGTMMAQLGVTRMPARPAMAPAVSTPTVVVAKNDETETKNLAVIQAMADASNKNDLKAVDAVMADDYKLVEIAQPKDMDKKAASASMKEFHGAFSDLKMSSSSVWAAGDYVVYVGKIEGTNTGDMPSMGLKKTGKKMSSRFIEVFKLKDGKVQEDWLFYNGAAFAAQMGIK